MTVHAHFSTPPRPGLLLVGVVAGLLLAAAAVAYVGTREPAVPDPLVPHVSAPAPGPVVWIELPQAEFPVPPGEHREAFVASCVQCHSPRLAFTQPRLPAKKWAEVVAKMVKAHKAPIAPAEQEKVVAYLSEVHGE